jgi:Rrf2 family transcriptional regulator, iron-sulfur cluster assembly transcription factor
MLSVTVQHALRALTVLAGLPDGVHLLGKELAKQAEIPANYLSKILWLLGGAGFIDATRGNGGGYRLHRPAAQIRLADVVDVFEGHRGNGSRLAEHSNSEAHAAVQKPWHELDEALTHFLRTTTIADIANTPKPH